MTADARDALQQARNNAALAASAARELARQMAAARTAAEIHAAKLPTSPRQS